MELVYLWIEDYKNIKRQGFTFSPRFKCEFKPKYNEKDELIPEESELIIEEKKDYVNIFPDNINVTAIVGKNGAGKSSVLEFIQLFLFAEKHIQNNYKGFLLLKETKNSDDLYLLYRDNKPEVKNETNLLKKEISLNKKFFKDVFSDTLTILFDKTINFHDILDIVINYNKSEYFDSKETSYLKIPKKSYGKIDIVKYIKFNEIISLKNMIENKYNFTFIEPYKIKLYYNIYSILNLITNIPQHNEPHHKRLFKFFYNEKFYKNKNLYELLDYLKNVTSAYKKEYNNNDPAFFFEINNILSSLDKMLENGNLLKNIPVNLSKDDYIVKNQKIIEITEFEINNKSNLFLNEIVRVLKNDSINLFQIDLIDKNTKKTYIQLSDGEKQLSEILNIINYYIFFYSEEREKEEEIPETNESITLVEDFKYKKFLYLFNEPDVYLHPEWSKNLLNVLINSLKKLNQSFQFIITTHSPFILSDIPKENIIFMKEGKNVSDEVEIETFGANIHTLLTHGFFMEDGLMGEYAKEKINKVIEILNKPKSTNKEIEFCEKIISIIGEPIIKKQLQRMLDSKRLTKIDELEKEIELIKARIEILRKNS